jgi:hypothetical protein
MNRRRQFGAAVLVAALALLLGGAGQVRAGFVITVSQSGPNVVATGSGSIDLTGLTTPPTNLPGAAASIQASEPEILVGPAASSLNVDLRGGATGGMPFGSGGGFFMPSSGSGDAFGIVGTSVIIMPHNYVSGTSLSATDTWANKTISGLGLTPGTYTWTWNTTPGVVGPNTPPTTDSVTVNIVAAVPEPASVIPLLTGALGLLGYGWRRRKQAA